MKKLITGTIAMAALIFSATAQESPAKPHVKDHSTHRQHRPHHKDMLKSLNLTDAQKQQMKANHASAKKQLADLEKNENITVKEYKARKEAIRKEQKNKMNTLLTAEQKTQLTKSIAERKQQNEQRRAQQFDKMKMTLNLSDEQVNKLKANRAAQAEGMKAIMENDQLSKAAKREKMTALREQNKASFKEVLTPEQQVKIEEMKKNRSKK